MFGYKLIKEKQLDKERQAVSVKASAFDLAVDLLRREGQNKRDVEEMLIQAVLTDSVGVNKVLVAELKGEKEIHISGFGA